MAKLLTHEQAARAIYFDFEGCVDEAPSLLGLSFVCEDGAEQFRQWIVEDALASATRTVPHTGGAVRCGRSTLSEAVALMVDLAEGQDRLIVSWARFDMDKIEHHVSDPELVERARARFMNALPTARQWLKRAHPQLQLERTRSGKHRLCRYCEIMGIRVPEKYNQDVAAKGIRVTRAAIARYGCYAAVPQGSGARASWKAVLGHNRLDCQNAREVVTRSSST